MVNTEISIVPVVFQFGRESKVTLEYWWDTGGVDEGAGASSEMAKSQDDGSLCLALQKLLSIAKHNYGTSKVRNIYIETQKLFFFSSSIKFANYLWHIYSQMYDNASGSNETVISSRVPSAKESTFRRPLIPQVYHKMGTQDAFKTQLDVSFSHYLRHSISIML